MIDGYIQEYIRTKPLIDAAINRHRILNYLENLSRRFMADNSALERWHRLYVIADNILRVECEAVLDANSPLREKTEAANG